MNNNSEKIYERVFVDLSHKIDLEKNWFSDEYFVKKELTPKEKKEKSLIGCFFTKEELEEKEKLSRREDGLQKFSKLLKGSLDSYRGI